MNNIIVKRLGMGLEMALGMGLVTPVPGDDSEQCSAVTATALHSYHPITFNHEGVHYCSIEIVKLLHAGMGMIKLRKLSRVLGELVQHHLIAAYCLHILNNIFEERQSDWQN